MTKPTKVMIAVPCFAMQVYSTTVMSLLAFASTSTIPTEVRFHSGALIGLMRNDLVATFLASDATHLMLVDADVGFEARAIEALVRSGLDVAGGAYPRKDLAAGGFVLTLPDGPLRTTEVNGELFAEVDTIGTGFLCVRRRVFERMIAAFGPTLRYQTDGGAQHDFFGCGPDPFADTAARRYLSEDSMFIRRWQRLDGKAYVSTTAVLTHAGPLVFHPPPLVPWLLSRAGVSG